MTSDPPEPKRCAVCHTTDVAILRCAQCKMIQYCSIQCQKRNWKLHRPHCRAVGAYKELCGIIRDTENPLEQYERSKDQIRMEEQRPSQEDDAPSGTVSEKSVSQERGSRFPYRIEIQHITNLCYYQLRIIQDADISSQIKVKEVCEDCRSDGYTLVFFTDHCALRLPKILEIDQVRFQGGTGQSKVLRMPYSPHDREDANIQIAQSLLPTEELSQIHCQKCNGLLLRAPIRETFALPSNRWDDMLDYLICYPGQSTVEFGGFNNTAQEGTVLQDDTHLIYHVNDFREGSILFSGENNSEARGSEETEIPNNDDTALTRGDRPYRDSVGGVGVLCSNCSSVLGYAPTDLPDTVRLLRHCVGADRSLTQFIVCEMIRYAETKAVFSFVITQEGTVRALRLRLISWNVPYACESDIYKNGDNVYDVHWRRESRFTYCESVDPRYNLLQKRSQTWTMDICCPPENEQAKGSVSYARLHLHTEEWQHLRQELKELRSYSNEEAEAIICATAGQYERRDSTLVSITV